MDTNQETGVSLQDVADLIEEEDQSTDESGENETVDEVADGDDSETEETAEEGGDDVEEIEKFDSILSGYVMRGDYAQHRINLDNERNESRGRRMLRRAWG